MATSADPTRPSEDNMPTTEATPLLGAPESGPSAIIRSNGHASKPTFTGSSSPTITDPTTTNDTTEEEDEPEKPFPYTQIALLCYASLAEPVAYFAIFPFINEMVFRLGQHQSPPIPESSVGFWTGTIESLFSVVQMLLMIVYGRAADRWGRKPVLVFSLAGVSVATAVFGLSGSLGGMIVARCFAGLFAGSVVTVRTMISENCTKQSQARAFSWYMFMRNMGIFVGPLIGGPLACPADPARYPGAFCKTKLSTTFPYALATFTAGAVCFSGCVLCVFFLKETLDRTPTLDADGGPVTTPTKKIEMSTLEVLRSPGVPMVLYILGHSNLASLGYTAVSPVWLFTSVKLGGVSFDDRMIAAFLAVAGASQALWILLVFPPLQKRFATGNVLRGTTMMFPVLVASMPFFNELRRHGEDKVFWLAFLPSLAVCSSVAMSFACIQLAINDIAPSSHVLATVNALALAVNSGVRAFAPVVFTSLFAVGVKSQWADGHLVWVVLFVLAVGLHVACWFLPKQAEGRYEQQGAKRKAV
ncbi:hypothetical protein LTR62_006932 [Meristemomyces frigidus]|uniref:Major facilitator superfamily (MFS) profile domain-containing protein n=1 Tax=Meristemomyces frigidus TaxID=1508187 RepID=A0AAN7TD23_9PEZI|nr:hypothetical protein LTR62_006932 [Meristemomyces frigidus]